MATLSTSCSEDIAVSRQYPYPSHVNAASFVSVKLSGKSNYESWKEQMMCLMESHDMLDFVNGILKNPEKNNGSRTEFREWKRSDALVKGWIFGSLEANVMKNVLRLQTADKVWNQLETSYATPTEDDIEDFGKYVPLCRAIEMGNWAKAQEIFNQDKDALTHTLNGFGETTLHVAIGNPDNILLLENLLEQIDSSLLPTLVDKDKATALHHAACLDNIEGAKKLVERNPSLLFSVDVDNCLPIETAIINTHKTTFMYLLEKCEEHINLSQMNGHPNPFDGENGVSLLEHTILSGFLDVAYYLLKNNPQLASTIGDDDLCAPLYFIAQKSDAYLSAERYNFYQRFVYSHVPAEDNTHNTQDIENQGTGMANLADMGTKNYIYRDVPAEDNTHNAQDIENQGTGMANLADMGTKNYIYRDVPTEDNTHNTQDNENQGTGMANLADMGTKNYIYRVLKRICRNFWKFALLHVQHVKNLHKDKVKHNTALKILMFICEEVSKQASDHELHYEDAFIVAVENNTPEVIKMITRTFPDSIWTEDDSGYTLSQLSIIHRSEKAYNFLVHGVTQNKYLHNSRCDKDENNLLHLVGRLAPIHKLNMVTGVALQMQRELQWFEEVKKFILPKEREAKNDEQETPIMVFMREHKDLRQKGEEWLKKTADSYTIIAALIITIVFAAAITVPGGNRGDTGKPNFETKPSFIIFAVSDAISLFTSTTSLLLFLSILTARYAEKDFLHKLPTKLILGLIMLFISVTAMIIAFSATLYIMFGKEKSWILIPIGAMTCLPIASFVTLQLPLLYDLICSTYGRGIFRVPPKLRVKDSQHYNPDYTLLAS